MNFGELLGPILIVVAIIAFCVGAWLHDRRKAHKRYSEMARQTQERRNEEGRRNTTVTPLRRSHP